MYSVSFFEPLPDLADEGGEEQPVPQYFASVGSNRTTVYKVTGEFFECKQNNIKDQQ